MWNGKDLPYWRRIIDSGQKKWGVFVGKGKIVPVELIFFGLRFRKLPLLKNNHSAPNMFENVNLKLHTVSVRLH